MNIAIDINGITAGGGLGNYLRQFVPALAQADKDNRYFLYLHSWNPPALPRGTVPDTPNFSLITQRLPQKAELLGERLLGLRLIEPFLLRRGIDVFHGPANILPRLRRIRSVLTLHHYMSPEDRFFSTHLGPMERFYFRATDASLTEATQIMTDSEFTRRDALGRFPLDPARVTTVYAGPSGLPPAPAPGRVREILAAYGLTERYLLFVGPINERKNLPRLLKAFALARASAPGLILAVSGDGAPAYMGIIKAWVGQLGLGPYVVFTGRTSAEQAAALYAGAAALCYPSLFEGFGYPPLEAMAAGCPVAASKAASIPEIVGKAGLLFDPENTAEMAAAIVRVSTDEALRAGLIASGREQAAGFSWLKAAREAVRIYGRAYNS